MRTGSWSERIFLLFLLGLVCNGLLLVVQRRLPQLGNRGAYLVQKMQDKLVEHRQYIRDNGIDLPEVQDFMDDFVPGFGMSLDEISRD